VKNKNEITSLENLELNLEEIKDENIRKSIQFVFNITEAQAAQIKKLQEENQKLRDENNLLKGEQGKPDIKPKNNGKGGGNVSSEKDRKQPENKPPKKRAPKKETVKVDRTEKCEIDLSILPADAVFTGYENTVIQDIQIQTNNVEYQRAVYYSPSLKRRFIADFPINHDGGEFGPQIKSLVLLMKHACNMSESKILEFVRSFGLSVSKGSLSNMLLKNKEDFHQEKTDIFKAGLECSSYQQTDDTGARVNGENHHTHIFCNQYYTAFFTKERKDRLTLLDILREGRKRMYCLNEEAFRLLKTMSVSQKTIRILKPLQKETVFGEEHMEKLISLHFPKIGVLQKKRILEVAAIAAYHKETAFPIVMILICDDAPQFKLLTEMLGLCWIHDGRHYKKLQPVIPYHKKLLDDFLKSYWIYYKKLLMYKKEPSEYLAKELSEEFDLLFSTKTGYADLDDRISKTNAKKEELMLVLAFSEIPLHNNAAELAARVQVRKRDVSLHTVTAEGTKVVDTFLTIVETAKKLGVNIYDYIFDRVSKNYELPSLADLIRRQSAMAS